MEDRTLAALAEDLSRLDHERWLVCLFAPAARRPELFALYGLNLEVAKTREVVSNAILGQIRLQWWRDALDELAAGAALRHPVLGPLRQARAEDRLDLERLHALIDAREGDLEDDPPATLADLEAYASATGGALARLHAGLLGAPDAGGAADAVGTAWALVGLMVALPYRRGKLSHGAGRLWLPADLMRQEGLSRGGIVPGSPTLAAVVRGVAERADSLLAAARAARRSVPRAARSALLLARIADERLARLRAAGFDPFALAARPSGLLPLRLALAAAAGRY
jgi:phytoene synthase